MYSSVCQIPGKLYLNFRQQFTFCNMQLKRMQQLLTSSLSVLKSYSLSGKLRVLVTIPRCIYFISAFISAFVLQVPKSFHFNVTSA